MNSIDAIQPNNIYRVNAVNLFENRNQNNARTNNIFSTGLFAQQTNENYNLNRNSSQKFRFACLNILNKRHFFTQNLLYINKGNFGD